MKSLIIVSMLFVIVSNPPFPLAQQLKPATPGLARIDVHTHVFNATPVFYALLNRLNLRVLNICVLDKHESNYLNLKEQQTAAIEAFRASQGRAADLRLLHLPIDHRRWGESSWLNYWQGRDEDLWAREAGGTSGAGDTGDDRHVPHHQPALGGS